MMQENNCTFAIAMVRQLVIPTFVLDSECRVIVWNNACERLTGMMADEVVGTREHWRAFYREPRPCLADLVVQGRTSEIESLYPTGENSAEPGFGAHAENWCVMPLRRVELYLSLDAGPIRDENGRIVAVVETLRDMTDHQRVKTILQLNASVFDNSQEGIVITDASGIIVNANKAAAEMTGYPIAEIKGRNPNIFSSGMQGKAFYSEMWRGLAETGQWRGELWNRKKSGEFYSEMLNINAVCDSDGKVIHYVGMFSDNTDRRRSHERLESLVNYDALTGLPNRTLLADRLHQAIANAERYNRMLAICFLDLDGFKSINDTHGHEIGDLLLIEAARRMKESVRETDTVARLGGDEFVLLLTEFERLGEIEIALERVLHSIAQPVRAAGLELQVSASIGATIFPVDKGGTDAMMRHADEAMYVAKQAGRNRYHFFNSLEQQVAVQKREGWERVRQALLNGELRVDYQPKIDMRAGKPIGVEALLCWEHPQHGRLGPSDFLPQIEHTPLVAEVEEWALHDILGRMASWNRQGIPMAVSINVSGPHFHGAGFCERLRAILARHPDVPPALLELEIHESAALENLELSRSAIARCRVAGVSVAIDNFGTCFSSLSDLARLHANALKIDRSLVRRILDDHEDLTVVEAAVGLASIFKMRVTADGVETAEHGLLLMQAGCDRGQGSCIAPPMHADEVPAWLASYQPDATWTLWAGSLWDRAQLPLVLASYDHIRWVQQVVQRLDIKNGAAAPGEPVDHRQCRFGKWYLGEGRQNFGHLPEYAAINDTHIEVHRVGSEIIQLREDGKTGEARRRIPELLSLKDRMLALLAELQQTVAVSG